MISLSLTQGGGMWRNCRNYFCTWRPSFVFRYGGNIEQKQRIFHTLTPYGLIWQFKAPCNDIHKQLNHIINNGHYTLKTSSTINCVSFLNQHHTQRAEQDEKSKWKEAVPTLARKTTSTSRGSQGDLPSMCVRGLLVNKGSTSRVYDWFPHEDETDLSEHFLRIDLLPPLPKHMYFCSYTPCFPSSFFRLCVETCH